MTPRQLALALRDLAVRDGYTELRALRVRVANLRWFTGRTFAATYETGAEIILSPELASQPDDIVGGIVTHEIGHALDFSYPGHWAIRNGEAILYDTAASPASRWWNRGHDAIERMADLIAESVFDVTIRYRGCQLLQSTTAGVRPRPRGL